MRLNTSLHRSSELFLGNVSAGWDVKDNQENIANFRLSDLQTGMSVGTSGIVSATMKHKMGLLYANIPSAQTADNVITYDGNSYNTSLPEKWNRITAKCTTVTWNASMNFTSSTHKPYKVISDSKLYFISKPSVSTVAISTTTGTQLYAWSASGSNTTIATANQYKQFTVATPDYSNAFNKKIWEFSYSGTGQQWVAPTAGTYTMECWGANGGASPVTDPTGKAIPGKGGYTSGAITLVNNTSIYVYVGGVGTNSNKAMGTENTGGFNGGGISGYNNSADGCAGGGGATDIRLVKHSSGTWGYNSSSVSCDASMRYRIMVAGGGGGASYMPSRDNSTNPGGCGGGLIGGRGTSTMNNYNTESSVCPGGLQDAVEQWASSMNTDADVKYIGGFGFASQRSNKPFSCWGNGGGGGWYGGCKGIGNGGGGGSSYILGHAGCNPVNLSTGKHLGTSTKTITYSGTSYGFSSTVMIDGDGYKWTAATQTRVYTSTTVPGLPKVGSTTATKTTIPSKPTQSNNNNGYCRITYTP